MTGNQTRAERMRQPLASDVIAATAEQHGVCVRPFTMEVGDLDTGELRYVPVPCGLADGLPVSRFGCPGS